MIFFVVILGIYMSVGTVIFMGWDRTKAFVDDVSWNGNSPLSLNIINARHPSIIL